MHNKAIQFHYQQPSPAELEQLKQHDQAVKLNNSKRIRCENSYFQQGIAGTSAQLWTRSIVAMKLYTIVNALPEQYGLHIYDAFRSRQTQHSIFQQFCAQIAKEHPDWQTPQVEEKAQEFASHPDKQDRFAIPLHLSGGAIDVALYDMQSGLTMDFGSGFDELSDCSHTDFYEKPFDPRYNISESNWLQYRERRRLLFHTMIDTGFVNFHSEWWHYDLGTCNWANQLGIDWWFKVMTIPHSDEAAAKPSHTQ